MFQALAQNTDLKERLRRIHAESMLLDPPAAPKSGDNLAEVGRFLSGKLFSAPAARPPPAFSVQLHSPLLHPIEWRPCF